MTGTLVLTNSRLADGRLVDITIGSDRSTGAGPAPTVVLDIAATGTGTAGGHDRSLPGRQRDLSGYVVLPRLREPHAHLDKALSADVVDNPDGDLGGAITAWLAHRNNITHDDYVGRATAAVELYASNGVISIRSHVDLGPDVGTRGLEALLEVKAAMAGRVNIELVGLPVGLTGDNSEAVANVCRRALELGLDVMGGVPHIEEDPKRAVEVIVDLAGDYDRPVDIHADENLRPDSSDLENLARAVINTGFEPSATASHCVALSMRPIDDQQRVAAVAAEALLTVVALPHTNLYLQARQQPTAPARGLAPVTVLRQAGVTVAAGGDNLQDPFNPLGSADPLETAALAVLAGHLSVEAAVDMVTVTGRATVAVGDRADLLALPARSLREAVAVRPGRRLLLGFDV